MPMPTPPGAPVDKNILDINYDLELGEIQQYWNKYYDNESWCSHVSHISTSITDLENTILSSLGEMADKSQNSHVILCNYGAHWFPIIIRKSNDDQCKFIICNSLVEKDQKDIVAVIGACTAELEPKIISHPTIISGNKKHPLYGQEDNHLCGVCSYYNTISLLEADYDSIIEKEGGISTLNRTQSQNLRQQLFDDINASHEGMKRYPFASQAVTHKPRQMGPFAMPTTEKPIKIENVDNFYNFLSTQFQKKEMNIVFKRGTNTKETKHPHLARKMLQSMVFDDECKQVLYQTSSSLTTNIGIPTSELDDFRQAARKEIESIITSSNKGSYVEGKYRGIGVHGYIYEGAFKIDDVFADTPAAKLGLRKGDIITNVGDESINGKSLNDAICAIRDSKDKKITVTRGNTKLEFNVDSFDLIDSRAKTTVSESMKKSVVTSINDANRFQNRPIGLSR